MKRAVRGSKGTFAGRPPLKCPVKREKFDAMKAAYLEARAENLESGAIQKPAKRRVTIDSNTYLTFMKAKMTELAACGVAGGERMRMASQMWKDQQPPVTSAGNALSQSSH